jgi:lipopolysaccharide/colanic/teichoic acid biosynthesis glycosyltransferase
MADTFQHTTRATTTPDNLVLRTAPPVSVVRRRMPLRKRLLDLAIAIPAAVLTAPVTLVLVAMSWYQFRQTPFFRQPRIGHGGGEFTFWKVRTLPKMVPDTADKSQLPTAPIPPFAQFLRNHHLDELPQLWLVIAGKMSIVGPRPEMPTLSASFDQGFVAERVSVKPGCTGLWQVSVGSRGLIGEAAEWDMHYVHNATVRLDLWIMFRTVLMMIRLCELQQIDDIPRWTGASTR